MWPSPSELQPRLLELYKELELGDFFSTTSSPKTKHLCRCTCIRMNDLRMNSDFLECREVGSCAVGSVIDDAWCWPSSGAVAELLMWISMIKKCPNVKYYNAQLWGTSSDSKAQKLRSLTAAWQRAYPHSHCCCCREFGLPRATTSVVQPGLSTKRLIHLRYLFRYLKHDLKWERFVFRPANRRPILSDGIFFNPSSRDFFRNFFKNFLPGKESVLR